MPETIGVILLTFGGADSPEAIEPFMTNLMGGRKPAPELVTRIKERYQLIGGKSPLPMITRLQADALENYLNDSDGSFNVVVGMRHWHPFIGEALDVLIRDGIKKVVAVSLAPFYSQVSTGTYEAELKRVLAEKSAGPEVIFAGGWYNHPMFINAIADKVEETFREIPEERWKDTPVIFSAHSLPVAHIENGDPYVQQFEATVAGVVRELGLKNCHIAYQSKGGGQGEWLGPMVEEVMDGLAAQGHKDVVVAPIGFVSDHIETLYDVDIAQKQHAASLGLNFYRTGSLNTAPGFIDTLAAVVLDEL